MKKLKKKVHKQPALLYSFQVFNKQVHRLKAFICLPFTFSFLVVINMTVVFQHGHMVSDTATPKF
jgi:hypothetical protein